MASGSTTVEASRAILMDPRDSEFAMLMYDKVAEIATYLSGHPCSVLALEETVKDMVAYLREHIGQALIGERLAGVGVATFRNIGEAIFESGQAVIASGEAKSIDDGKLKFFLASLTRRLPELRQRIDRYGIH